MGTSLAWNPDFGRRTKLLHSAELITFALGNFSVGGLWSEFSLDSRRFGGSGLGDGVISLPSGGASSGGGLEGLEGADRIGSCLNGFVVSRSTGKVVLGIPELGFPAVLEARDWGMHWFPSPRAGPLRTAVWGVWRVRIGLQVVSTDSW